MQTSTTSVLQALQILHEGGRIDRFPTGTVFLSNIFGELQTFDIPMFNQLNAQQWIAAVHLHYPCAECFKISAQGLAYLANETLEEVCRIPA